MSFKILIQAAAILSFLLSSCAGSKDVQHYGEYKTKSGRARITFKEDNTFVYYRGYHMGSTTALGSYELNSDTLTLHYTDKKYDSIITPKFDPGRTTLAQALGLPGNFLWKGKWLYLVVSNGKKLKYAKLIN